LEYVNDDGIKLDVLSALGTMYAKVGMHSEAEKRLLEAFEVAKKLKNARLMGAILNNLAVIYTQLQRGKEAEILLKKALEVLESAGTREDVASVLQNLLPYLNDADFGDTLEKLEELEDVSPAIAAKVRYFKAKKLEKEGKTGEAASNYFDAACLGFIAYRSFGLQSVNFMYCLEKVIKQGGELARNAATLKSLITRYYFGANVEVDLGSEAGDLIKEYLLSGELDDSTPFTRALRIIADDLKMISGDENLEKF